MWDRSRVLIVIDKADLDWARNSYDLPYWIITSGFASVIRADELGRVKPREYCPMSANAADCTRMRANAAF